MAEISRSVVKLDHGAKVRGEAAYVADHPTEGMLHGKLLRSQRPRAKILSIRLPDNLPEGCIVADFRDVPGENKVLIIKDDTPVFARTAEFVGDPIAIVAGPDESVVEQLLDEISVEYEDRKPVLDVREAKHRFFREYHEKGQVDRAFAEADHIFDERFRTGLQEHGYLEPQGLIATPLEGGKKIKVQGSIQCPYYVHKALVLALGLPNEAVQVVQDVTGGGFGGKEDYPSILACQAAVAALKANKPVRVIYDRREDMAYTSKRHPSETRYRAAVKDGKVTAMDIDVLYDAGAYTTMSKVVLQRGVICASGVYNIPHLRVRGRAMKTNTVPNGAFRGFGAPQTFFGIEMMMAHIAGALGEEPLTFKIRHLAKQGDETSTEGRYHFPVPLETMSRQVQEISDYWTKRKNYVNQTGRYRRGIGASFSFHGAGFTGSGERDIIKAVAKLRKYPDGKLEILTAGTELGQGLLTSFAKIVAEEAGLPLEQIVIALPDTDRVPDSGPTVASRSVMVVGELLRRAAAKLKARWTEGEPDEATERFEEPDFVIPFDAEAFQGDAYPTYSWGAHCVELEVDTFTGEHKVLGAWGSYDVGTPIDMGVIVGQMEGGLLQGIGYSHMEEMRYDKKGRIRGNSYSDYPMPTSADVPNMGVIIHVEEYPAGPYGAKGAGELPIVGVPGAYISALEQALGAKINHIPCTMEDSLTAWKEAGQA